MANVIKAQKGTKDILPTAIVNWHLLEEKALKALIPFMDVFFMLFMPLLQINTLFYTPKKWK